MSEGIETQSQPETITRDLGLEDLRFALSAGFDDFKAKPAFGLFFASIFVVAGMALTYFLVVRGEYTLAIPVAAGFPLIAPFTAVGLYEVSRRRELRIPTTWSAILGAVKGRGDEQILAMGVIIFVAFGFWVIVAHAVFAIAVIEAGAGSESLAFLTTRDGIAMLLIGTAIGGVMAFAFYAITVFSLPMLVHREVDFFTAIITSLAGFKANRRILLIWAASIACALFVSIVTAFLGLLITLPIFGHATWHLYRRAIG